MHDGLASYTNALPQEHHLYCWAHVLRFAHEETAGEPPDSAATRVKEHLVRIYHLKNDRSDSENLQARLRAELDQVLALSSESVAIHNIQGRLRVQYEGLIRALLCTPDATNNLAERELRSLVLLRKISSGSDTFGGMETTAVVGSVVQTLAKHDAPLLSTLQQSLQQGIYQHFSHSRHPVSLDSS